MITILKTKTHCPPLAAHGVVRQQQRVSPQRIFLLQLPALFKSALEPLFSLFLRPVAQAPACPPPTAAMALAHEKTR
jgi:hypothetical protein